MRYGRKFSLPEKTKKKEEAKALLHYVAVFITVARPGLDWSETGEV